ncbi:MAG: hypothetical protein HFJ28_06940 [Clostridia bacterium]|jgi:hypothetical protein|nr:hypothetical protein [Clostridia bacterium]
MLTNFVQFCTTWLEIEPRWPTIDVSLLVILVLVAPRKVINIKKIKKNKWTIFFR